MLFPPKLPDQLAACEEMLAHVCQQLEAVREDRPVVHAYVLIERGIDMPIYRMADIQLARHKHAVLFEGTPEEHLAKEFSPWLVQLPYLPDTEQLRQLCIASQRFAAIAWIWSPLPLDGLAAHLRHFMSAALWNPETGEDEGEVLLRCTDPRVFPGYVQALLPAQQADLLRPLNVWALWDRHRQWRQWHGDADLAPAIPAPLRISLPQLGVMNRHTQPDKILSMLNRDYGEQAGADNPIWQNLLQLPQDTRYRKLCAILDQARHLGYGSDEDLMLFAALIHLIHPRCYEFPLFRAELERGRHEGKPLAETVLGLPDSVRREIEQQHTHASSGIEMQDASY
jgi:hypothetical protein